jgi:hypothetical protein
MAQSELFVNWITGIPVALSNAVNSIFGAAGASHSPGLVPDPGAVAGPPNKFLRGDATFAQVDYASITGKPTGILLSIIEYSGSQTITIPTGSNNAVVQMWGATGGSGGTAGTGGAGGTGAGGYLEKSLTSITAGNTLIYTQAAAGIAGTAAPGNGGNAGATTLASGTQTITTLTCNGSNGSAAAGAGAASAGTAGGSATNGDINVTGQSGTGGILNTAAASPSPGGVNFFSFGASGVNNAGAGAAGNSGGLKVSWFT